MVITNGMVRRVDNLGRVVIPKEIRRTLRIGEGDLLEFLIDREIMILKKYSPAESNLSESLEAVRIMKKALKHCLYLSEEGLQISEEDARMIRNALSEVENKNN